MRRIPGAPLRTAVSKRPSHRTRAAALLAVVALLCACTPALAPRHHALSRELEAFSSASPVKPSEPLFDNATVLDRQALIQAVLDRNPSVRAAESAFRAALSRYPQVTALKDPTLSYGVAPSSFGSSSTRDGHKVELSQQLPFPGKLRLRGQAALAEAEASRYDLESLRLDLATAASHLYDDYYLVARSLDLNSEHVAFLADLKRTATARYESGKASQQDPLQAESELAHLVHEGVLLATQQRIVNAQLNALLHRSPRLSLPIAPSLLSKQELPADLEASLSRALESHPETRAAAAHIEARSAAVGHARRDFLPDFTLRGAYNTLWQDDDLRPFVGVSFNVPLQITARRAALNEAKARLDRAQALRARTEDRIRLAVTTATERLTEARHVERLFRDRLLPPARDRVEAASAAYASGQDEFFFLIDAERNLRTTRLGLEEARANLSRATTEMFRARGELPGGLSR